MGNTFISEVDKPYNVQAVKRTHLSVDLWLDSL